VKAGRLWRIRVVWDCSEPVRELGEDVDRFVDAAAVLAPSVPDAPWMTMGAPGKAVEGALWRADREELLGVRAEGLGTVERSAAPQAWKVRAEWKAGRWSLQLELEDWAALDARRRVAIAVWQGAQGDRGGLKSVSSGWIEVDS
jgi:DMSO reductase family type II enzyme heme b subunit